MSETLTNRRLYKTELPRIEYAFILLNVLYFIIPVAQTLFSFMITVAAEIGYVLYVGITRKDKMQLILRYVFTIAFIAFLYAVLNDAGSIGNVSHRGLKRFFSKFYQYTSMFFPLCLLYRTVFFASFKQKRVILLVALVGAIISSKIILNYIAIDPLAARNFGREGEEDFGPGFVAPYAFVYGMTYTVLLLVSTLKLVGSNKLINKLVALILLGYFVYFLFFM